MVRWTISSCERREHERAAFHLSSPAERCCAAVSRGEGDPGRESIAVDGPGFPSLGTGRGSRGMTVGFRRALAPNHEVGAGAAPALRLRSGRLSLSQVHWTCSPALPAAPALRLRSGRFSLSQVHWTCSPASQAVPALRLRFGRLSLSQVHWTCSPALPAAPALRLRSGRLSLSQVHWTCSPALPAAPNCPKLSPFGVVLGSG